MQIQLKNKSVLNRFFSAKLKYLGLQYKKVCFGLWTVVRWPYSAAGKCL